MCARIIALLFAVGMFTACESTDSGSGGNTTVYYGAAFYDPWYHGDYDHDHDYNVVVTPPPSNRPPLGESSRPRPEHPIANPPGGGGDYNRPARPSQQPSSRPPSASTRPSIPSAPRPAHRGGGGRR